MDESNVVRPTLSFDNIPDELKITAKRHQEIRRFIDEYLHSPDYKEGESAYESLSDEDKVVVSRLALLIHSRAIELEPDITKMVIGLVPEGVELTGYKLSDGSLINGRDNHTIKTIESLRRKIIANSDLNDDVVPDYNKAVETIKDSIRYTIIIPPETYLEKVDEILHRLESAGFDSIEVRNYWVDCETCWKVENRKNWSKVRCQGINTKIGLPNGQDFFEIQFHTPMEQQIKEGSTRDLYKVYRDRALDLEWKQVLENYRMFLQSTIVPPDTKELKACEYRFVPRDKRR